jgi:hypothetical protein
MMSEEKSVRKWTIRKTDVGGIYFLGPKGRVLFLAPYASEKEQEAVMNALPKYVKEFFEENFINENDGEN